MGKGKGGNESTKLYAWGEQRMERNRRGDEVKIR